MDGRNKPRPGPEGCGEGQAPPAGVAAVVGPRRPGEGPDTAPESFRVADCVYRVAGVSDWWPGRAYEHFRVRTDCGAIYLLHHHLESGTWLAEWLGNTDA